jgi:hypothetical protein
MKYLSRCTVSDFAALQALCARDPVFPKGQPEWDELIAENDRVAATFGELPSALQIDVDDFHQWCWTVAVQPGLDVLKSYVIVLRHQQSDRIGGFDRIAHAPSGPMQLDS